MKTIIVSRDAWVKCFSLEYALTGRQGGDVVKESLAEKYGIEHWEKVDFDKFRMTFFDDEKMTLWILRWT
jgi:hypothetical protein